MICIMLATCGVTPSAVTRQPGIASFDSVGAGFSSKPRATTCSTKRQVGVEVFSL